MTSKNSLTYSVRINQGPIEFITPSTGFYDLAAATAVGMLEHEEEEDGVAIVEIWIEKHLPDYPPTFFEVGRDESRDLRVRHLPGCERRPDGSIIMKAYQGHGQFKWYERKDGEWQLLAMWQPVRVAT